MHRARDHHGALPGVTADPLERTIKVAGVHFRVVGVSEPSPSTFGQSQDEFVVIPMGRFRKLFGSRPSLILMARPETPEQLERAMDDATAALRIERRLRPAEDNDFGLFTSDTVLDIYDQATAGIFAVLGAVLHGLSFGLDPLRNKGMEGVDLHQTDRVARAVDVAEAHLAAMSDAIRRAQDRGLEARVAQFQLIARDLFRTVENDPRDLTAARKYLGIYLQGARDATVKFADLYARARSAEAKAGYEALLVDLEQNFAARTQKLLSDDAGDVTVEIEVLRERLQREGVRPEYGPE